MKQKKNYKPKTEIPRKRDASQAMDPGQDATARSNRKGAGEQQRSGGNPVID